MAKLEMNHQNQFSSSVDESSDGESKPPASSYTVTLYIKFITVCSAMSGFLSCYNLAILSGTMLLIKEEYLLNTIWHEIIVSTSVATASVTSLGAGFLNDWQGKKPVLLTSSFMFAFGAAILGGALRKEVFVAGQVITGVAIGKYHR